MFTFDHLSQARHAMGDSVIPDLNADVPTTHLVRHGGGGARAEEGVEHKVAGIGGDMQNALEQAFRLGRAETDICPEKTIGLLFALVSVSSI